MIRVLTTPYPDSSSENAVGKPKFTICTGFGTMIYTYIKTRICTKIYTFICTRSAQ